MSKSDTSDATRINMTDSVDDIAQKIKRADGPGTAFEAEGLVGRPEARNLVGIFSGLSGRTEADILTEFGGQGFGVFKSNLAALAVNVIFPIREKMNQLLAEPDEIDKLLASGAEQAHAITGPILGEVKKIIGLSSH